MKEILNKLTDLRHEISGRDYYDKSAADALASHMLQLVDIVAELASAQDKDRDDARRTANVASCLANGIKPD